jgi:ATP-grasp domain
MREVLLLFSFDWDQSAAQRLSRQYHFHQAGFDLFSFPSSAQLLWFNIIGWVNRLEKTHRPAVKQGRLKAVVSHDEQFGALAAALLAERLGLPHTPAHALIQIQHKLLLRQLIEQVRPDANVRFKALDCEYGHMPPKNIEFPVFIKPVKAAFSVLARRIESYEELVAHTRFGFFEQWIIQRLTKPFNDVAKGMVQLPIDADHMILEEPIQAAQFDLDGYVVDGEVFGLGVVDELMYPGTQAFLRFQYPSKLPQPVCERAKRIAQDVLAAAGFTHGFFNMEFFYDASSDRISIIEINPRLASQLADLHYWVDGVDIYAMAIAMACGDDMAQFPREKPRAGVAASLVFRSFGEALPPPASAADVAWMQATFPDSRLVQFHKPHNNTKRDMKWLGSFRYAVLDMHAPDETSLNDQFKQVCTRFGWPCVVPEV